MRLSSLFKTTTASLLLLIINGDNVIKEYELQCWPKEQQQEKVDEICEEYMKDDINTHIQDFMCSEQPVRRQLLRSSQHQRALGGMKCKDLCWGWSPKYCNWRYPWCSRRLLEENNGDYSLSFLEYNTESTTDKNAMEITSSSNAFVIEQQEHYEIIYQNNDNVHHRQLETTSCYDEAKRLKKFFEDVGKQYNDLKVDDTIDNEYYKNTDFNNNGIIGDDDDKDIAKQLLNEKKEQIKYEKDILKNKQKCAKLMTSIMCKCTFYEEQEEEDITDIVIDDSDVDDADDGDD